MKFSNTHEWAELNDSIAVVGISNFGRIHLGDIINIKLPNVNENVKKDQIVCTIESNKAAVDIHTPLSGTIIEINKTLERDLKPLNISPEQQGWIFKVKISNKQEFESLMSLQEYEKKVSK